jgi:DNA-binding GntR family transcriptional regulator
MQSPLMSETRGLLPFAAISLPEQIADRIVDAICIGQISAGQRLIETELAQTLNVSRGPVREAIRILDSQGIIVSADGRGMRVADFDKVWADQLLDVRVAIEQQAALQAAAQLVKIPSLARELNAKIDELGLAEGDWLAVNKGDADFHTKIFELANNRLLLTLWAAISRHVQILFSIESKRDPDFQVVLDDHRLYLETLLHGSASQISSEIRDHINKPKLRG